jgi:DNA-binding transcriptional LysR family regulator
MQKHNAISQYRLGASDLQVILALARTRTLAEAGARLAVDASTVFRTVQKIEKGLGQRLFERSRSGYLPSDMAQTLADRAEQIEIQLEAAHTAAQTSPGQVAGSVRITTTDTVLHYLIAPALKPLQKLHPLLEFALDAGNELASLTRRDADIAVRATRRPPQHLVGKHVGPIRMALFAGTSAAVKSFNNGNAAELCWIAPDDALPEHPSVLWRKKQFPKINPTYRVNSILTVAELVGQGLGIGLLPIFLAQRRAGLKQLTEVLDECQTELWLLTHTESRHLRRVSTVFSHLSHTLQLA